MGLLGEADGLFQFENEPADIDEDDGWPPYARLAGSIAVLAMQDTPSCFITVTISDLVSQQASFAIDSSGS